MESGSMPSDPPPASCWAAPPEFYLDENAVTRTVRRVLSGLGYSCHTPAEVFGTRLAAEGADDTEWLRRVTGSGWVVLNRDAQIMQRPDELAAYRAAKVHMFYLPGEATRDQLRHLVERHLRDQRHARGLADHSRRRRTLRHSEGPHTFSPTC